MKVGDLTVSICDNKGNWNSAPIRKSPYYKSLIHMDSSIFLNYYKLLEKFSTNFYKEMTWDMFKDLALIIALRGVDNEKMKDIDIRDGVVFDGQHRMSIVFALYGKDYDISQWEELQK